MFVQVIQGKTNDAEGLRRQFDRWQDELQAGAQGWLGSTGGVTENGDVVVLARFADESAARANSDRPEQGAWWNETAKYFDGEPVFRDYTDVDVTLGGGSDDAGFVQVMQGKVKDRERLSALEAEWMPKMTEQRPDVIGSIRGWKGNEYTEAIYFTSEAAAREGERKMSQDEKAAEFGEYLALMDGDVTYLDLKDPWLRS